MNKYFNFNQALESIEDDSYADSENNGLDTEVSNTDYIGYDDSQEHYRELDVVFSKLEPALEAYNEIEHLESVLASMEEYKIEMTHAQYDIYCITRDTIFRKAKYIPESIPSYESFNSNITYSFEEEKNVFSRFFKWVWSLLEKALNWFIGLFDSSDSKIEKIETKTEEISKAFKDKQYLSKLKAGAYKAWDKTKDISGKVKDKVNDLVGPEATEQRRQDIIEETISEYGKYFYFKTSGEVDVKKSLSQFNNYVGQTRIDALVSTMEATVNKVEEFWNVYKSYPTEVDKQEKALADVVNVFGTYNGSIKNNLVLNQQFNQHPSTGVLPGGYLFTLNKTTVGAFSDGRNFDINKISFGKEIFTNYDPRTIDVAGDKNYLENTNSLIKDIIEKNKKGIKPLVKTLKNINNKLKTIDKSFSSISTPQNKLTKDARLVTKGVLNSLVNLLKELMDYVSYITRTCNHAGSFVLNMMLGS